VAGWDVVPESEAPWKLERFVERLDLWVDVTRPSEDLRIRVTEQIFTRMEHPYRGVKRVAGSDNLWFGVIPGSSHDPGMVVTWAYRIFDSRRAVRCDLIESLSYPI
jgi:hypothetical protein